MEHNNLEKKIHRLENDVSRKFTKKKKINFEILEMEFSELAFHFIIFCSDVSRIRGETFLLSWAFKKIISDFWQGAFEEILKVNFLFLLEYEHFMCIYIFYYKLKKFFTPIVITQKN